MNKKSSTAYILALVPLLVGMAGFNRFYVGKIGTGIIYLFTFGLFGIGIIYDLFTIPQQVRMANLLKNANTINQQNVIVNVNK